MVNPARQEDLVSWEISLEVSWAMERSQRVGTLDILLEELPVWRLEYLHWGHSSVASRLKGRRLTPIHLKLATLVDRPRRQAMGRECRRVGMVATPMKPIRINRTTHQDSEDTVLGR